MSQIRITDLPVGSALTGPEKVPAVQGGVTVSSTATDFKNFVIPAQGGNAGKLLGTNGVSVSWVNTPIVNLSTGVTGNLSTANLAGGAGATSATFWRGDGTWASATGNLTSSTVINLAGMPVGQQAYIAKATSTPRNNTNVPTTDPDLAFTNLPIGTYLVEAILQLFASGAANGGFAGNMFFGGATNYGGYSIEGFLNAPLLTAPFVNTWLGGPAVVVNGALNGVTQTDWLRFRGFLVAGVIGNFGIGWAQNTSNSVNTWVLIGSYISVNRVL